MPGCEACMHLAMAFADSSQDCLIRLSSEADFRHLEHHPQKRLSPTDLPAEALSEAHRGVAYEHAHLQRTALHTFMGLAVFNTLRLLPKSPALQKSTTLMHANPPK